MAEYAYEGENGEGAYELLYNYDPKVVNKAYSEKVGGDSSAACYRNFTPEVQTRVNTLWEELKSDIDVSPTIIIICVAIVGALVAGVVVAGIKKKYRNNY